MKKNIEFYKIIKQGKWQEFYKIIKEINENETFWDSIDKYQLAELNFISWELGVECGVGVYEGFDEEFLSNIAETSKNGYKCYKKRFQAECDNDLLYLMGFIATVGYTLVPTEYEYLEFEAMGEQMMKDAYKNEPENPFIACLTLGNNALKKDAKEYLHRVFRGCDGIIEYFDFRFYTYELTNNSENWKKLYEAIYREDWEFMVGAVNKINEDEPFWYNASKAQVIEISYCCWHLLHSDVGYDDKGAGFYNIVAKVLNQAYNCYKRGFSGDSDLKFLLGYIMSEDKRHFIICQDDGVEFENIGEQMMQEAYENDKNNPFIAYINAQEGEKNKFLKGAKEYLCNNFKECMGVIEYFYYIVEDYLDGILHDR